MLQVQCLIFYLEVADDCTNFQPLSRTWQEAAAISCKDERVLATILQTCEKDAICQAPSIIMSCKIGASQHLHGVNIYEMFPPKNFLVTMVFFLPRYYSLNLIHNNKNENLTPQNSAISCFTNLFWRQQTADYAGISIVAWQMAQHFAIKHMGQRTLPRETISKTKNHLT